MQFFGVTVYKMDEKDLNPALKVRFKIEDIVHYQEYSPGAIVYLKNNKIYVKENVEQLDLILNGANEKTVGLLYGEEHE